MDSEELKKEKIYGVQAEMERVFKQAKNTKDVEKAYNNLKSNQTKSIVLGKIKDEDDRKLITENYDVVLDYVHDKYKEELKYEPINLSEIKENGNYDDVKVFHDKASLDDYDDNKIYKLRFLNRLNNVIIISYIVMWCIAFMMYIRSIINMGKVSMFFIIIGIISCLFIKNNCKEMKKLNGKYSPVGAIEISFFISILLFYLLG